MSGAGIIKTNYENTYSYFYPRTLQFGDTGGGSSLYDVKVLANGDYAVAGSSTATTIDGNANPYASSYFIAVIDKLLPSSGFIKQIKYFDTSSSKMLGLMWGGSRPNARIDTDGINIYYVYGTYGSSDIAGWVCGKLPATNFAGEILSATFTIFYGNCCAFYYNNFVWVQRSVTAGVVTRLTKLNSSDMTLVSDSDLNSITGSYSKWCGYMLFDSHKIYNHGRTGAGYSYARYSKLDDATLTLELGGNRAETGGRFGNVPLIKDDTTPYEAVYCSTNQDTNNIYLWAFHETDREKTYIQAFKKSNFTNTWAANNYLINTCAAGKREFYYGGCPGSSTFLLVGSSNSTPIGTLDPKFIQVSLADGSVVASGTMKYSGGGEIAQSSKAYNIYAMESYETDKFVVVGSTTGNLSGFSPSTSTSCILMKVGPNGRILA